jgi:hypothetical protein
MLSKEPTQQVSATRQGEADREHELGAERVVIHHEEPAAIVSLAIGNPAMRQ